MGALIDSIEAAINADTIGDSSDDPALGKWKDMVDDVNNGIGIPAAGVRGW